MQHGKPELASNRKIMKNNNLTVDSSRNESKRLAQAISQSYSIANTLSDDDQTKGSKLKSAMLPLYTMLRDYAETAFQREFELELMFEAKVEQIDFIKGITKISFVHSAAQHNTVYNIVFRNHLYEMANLKTKETNWSMLV